MKSSKEEEVKGKDQSHSWEDDVSQGKQPRKGWNDLVPLLTLTQGDPHHFGFCVGTEWKKTTGDRRRSYPAIWEMNDSLEHKDR